MQDVFVLGAGFSRAVLDRMPLLSDLTDEVRKRVGDLSGSGVSPACAPAGCADLESILSYLSERHPWQSEREYHLCRAAFVEASEAVVKVFQELEGYGGGAPDIPDWLVALAKEWIERRATVITLNYDTLVERAAKRSAPNSPLTDFYRLPLARGAARTAAVLAGDVNHALLHLIKLHGSVNWYYSGRSDFPGEQVYYVEYGEEDRWKQAHFDRQNLPDKVPFIVPPIALKSPFYGMQLLGMMWQQARHAVGRADRLFFLGYSLPPTDLPMGWFVLDSVSDKTPEAHIVNVADTTEDRSRLVDRYRNVIPDRGRGANWDFVMPVSDEPVRQFTEWYIGEGDRQDA